MRIIDFIQNNLEFHTLCEILATDGLFLEFHTCVKLSGSPKILVFGSEQKPIVHTISRLSIALFFGNGKKYIFQIVVTDLSTLRGLEPQRGKMSHC